MSSSSSDSPAPHSVAVSQGSDSPWLKILWQCLLWVGVAAVVASIVALFFFGWEGVINVISATLLVAVFSGISLLIAHFVGRKNPSAVMGAFLAAYAVKVVGFGVLVFTLPRPDWVIPHVFIWSAVGAVILWQIAEVFTFARTRWLLYGDA